jgi:AcrR family transcriptional regulator
MPAASSTPRRRDAQRNREAILDAARELFADSADVPLYEVARRAGVGQATLYRHFPDRDDLAAALIAEAFEREEQVATEHEGDPDALFVLLRSIVQNITSFAPLAELALTNGALGAALEIHRRRLGALLKRPLRDAKAAGTVRRDLTVDDLFLMMLMVRGALTGADGAAARAAAAGRALTLALDGITAGA